MQRIINNPDLVVEDMLEGFLKANPHIIEKAGHSRVLKYKNAPIKGKVGIVTGGGSGHKPAFIGYIGKNMVDSVAVGEIFSSPTAKAFFEAFKVADGGMGVACLYGNYAGDNLNVKMAIEEVKNSGIEVRTVVANDDVPSAPKENKAKRRGVAGEVLMWKVGGAKAALGGNLDEVINISQKAIDNTRSIGIGVSPCTIPSVGKPNFKIEPGKMEIGIGHHGEPGIKIDNLRTADKMAEISVNTLLPDLPFNSGDEVVVLVSGLGATPVMELYIYFNEVAKLLFNKNLKIYKSHVGNYFTSLEMMGVTLSIMKLDDELKQLIDLECKTVGLTQF